MKRVFSTFLLFFMAIVTFAQKPIFKIKYSEQLAVFQFIKNLSSNYPENVFKTEFNKSKYNNDIYQKLINDFDNLSIDYSYSFDEYPFDSKIPMQTRDFLFKNLIETDNLTEFKLRSIGLIPNKTLNDLTKIISSFTPIYNELIYLPNKEQFEKQLTEITNYSEQHSIENYFQTGLTFYNSSWDYSIPFEIAFYPLPNSKGFSANAFCNNFVSAIQTNLKDYKVLFSVMLHETFHIIYNEQSLEVKNEIDKNFKENKSKCSNYAYLLMNEVLATALGNGYVFENLDGKIDTEDWYNKKQINLMAKQIYPMVKDYILQKKSIDKNFIDNYIKIYEDNFSNWIDDLDNLMTYRYVLSENDKDFKTIDSLYSYHSNSNYETGISESNIEKMQKSPLTKIIIVSTENKDKLKLIKRKFKELKNWKYNANDEFNFKILLDDKSQLFIINQKKSKFETLFKK